MTPAAALAQSQIKLTPAQQQMAEAILGWVAKRGYSLKVGIAAVANAWAESRLNPRAVSGYAGEDSVGLFQLNAARGAAGEGMSALERMDPYVNTMRILDVLAAVEAQRGPLVSGAENAEKAAKAFCIYVERPANATAEGTARAGYAARLFPQYSTSRTLPVVQQPWAQAIADLPPLRGALWPKIAAAGLLAWTVWG